MLISRINSRLNRIVILAAAVTLTATACGGSSGGSNGPYTVGAVVPLSGVNAVYGDAYRVAIDICTNYVNENLNLDRKIKVNYVDGQALPAPSVTAMNKVINVDGATAVLTGFSAPTKALAPIASQRKIPLFNGGASSPDLQGLGDYVFNNIPLANQQIPASATYAVDKLGLKKWAVLYSNETLGLSVLKSIEKTLPDVGGAVIDKAEISSQATDFGAQVAQLRVKTPDAIFIATTSGGQVPTIIRQIRAAGIKSRLISYAGTDIPATLSEPGAEGMLFTSQSINYGLDQPLTRFFISKFGETNPGKEPSILQANYCSEMSIIATSIKSLEKAKTKVTGESLMKEIRKIGKFDVVGGEVTFRDDGTISLPIDVRELSGGVLKVVYTYTAKGK